MQTSAKVLWSEKCTKREKKTEISGNLEVEIFYLKTLYFSPSNVKIGGSF